MSRISNNLNASQYIIEKLIDLGVEHFVISPGSRSTPLTVAVARNDRAKQTIHFDERGAAFHALGLAKGSKSPSVLVCTSGTAVANYFPAIIEAAMDNVPLFILSADRPPELIGVGANQAIYQENIYGSYPRWYANLDPPDQGIDSDHLNALLESMWSCAVEDYPGPAHLNCQFREPFLGSDQQLNDTIPQRSESAMQERQAPIPEQHMQSLQSSINDAATGLIVLGRHVLPKDQIGILALAEQLNWPVLPDVQCSLRFKDHPSIINYFDLALLKTGPKVEKPELVLQFGGAFTSKRLLTYLDDEAVFQISVKASPEIIDPNHKLDLNIEGDISNLLDQLDVRDRSEADWLERWRIINHSIRATIETYFQNSDDLSEPAIHHFISRALPKHHRLFLANSMPIRDMEMFAKVGVYEGQVYANRGASGIDGLFATTTGIAKGSGGPITAIIGDLAALHDLNSLALCKPLSEQIIFIVINNHGGGIFNFLPITGERDVFDEYFGTPHSLSFKQGADMFGLAYSHPQNLSEFKSNFKETLQNGQSTLIEITTDRYENHQLHKDIFKLIREH
ncbi:MAG: 2-succinyl-5-enolpyruvyl-6-hydroxy-3-cyclohexene-1-carboxylic-acid synthase [Candidatus Marinimicrobia bacterium]|nr:2-succinyl-5-enolpyruvyl-6-hydroxy-3-cyclohexene-1-carboxylic-acid synthase [Candidatus Neomarinimicrobiota bacterium]MCF7850512.1 2-succinyl-5-enolpyruvyl-6-hydroxy-3-cyclohexene-1-carboxylic-acid synthase [Candidatus Neomarinimicrobiota bacterium]MCF7903975.1 2-succinyl-5-enolpyruvyl-6-hydroxy-3-cyclohexene-1-carboxylic-acid synthase [Candidatus Neomarinimicrobiota bacterium]